MSKNVILSNSTSVDTNLFKIVRPFKSMRSLILVVVPYIIFHKPLVKNLFKSKKNLRKERNPYFLKIAVVFYIIPL